VLQILTRFFEDCVTSLCFTNNSLTDSVLQTSLLPVLRGFQNLQKLEVSNNRLTTASLETFGLLFQARQQLTDINLSSNDIGGGSHSSGERELVDSFLYRFFTELQAPRSLDLSYNRLTDECLYPVVRYVFANHECKLEYFSLENNRLSPFASRTVLKAYAISPSRESMVFRFGPLPLSLENLRAGPVTRQDQECIAKLASSQTEQAQNLGASPADSANQSLDWRHLTSQTMELTIKRKSNNFAASGNVLKRAPVSRADREKMDAYTGRIESIIQEREATEIEDLREFVQEITGHEIEFELPRYLLEPIFGVVNEKLDAAIEYENIYMLEVLLDCLKFMNARNIPAEKKYYELANEAHLIAHELLKVVNMEVKDDTEMQRLLVTNLKRGKQIGLRGELIDTARHLYLLTDKVLGEMRGKAAAVSDDEDEALYEVNEEDRPLNVYDARLDGFIEAKPEALGLTSEVEPHLAYHPYSTDYLKLANLNLNYVKKNLNEAKKFLKDEESYAYRNIFERCSVLLSDAGDRSEASITYNLARNDSNLKLARLIFRYRNNLDLRYQPRLERPPPPPSYREQMSNATFREADPTHIAAIAQLPHLRSLEVLTESAPFLERSLTDLPAERSAEAVKFSRRLAEVMEGDVQPPEAKTSFYSSIQGLFEEFIVQSLRPRGAPKIGIRNPDLGDEFYLQLYRLASIQAASSAQKQSMTEILKTMLLMALLSNYVVPTTLKLREGLTAWLLRLRGNMRSHDILGKIIARTLNNFLRKEAEDGVEDPNQRPHNREEPERAEGAVERG
jgi:hypothetical protein